MSEREVSRLAQDMRSGNAQDAVNVIRYELQTQPQQALQDIRAANNYAGPNARLHLGHKADGDMALVDNAGRPVAHLGHLQQQYSNYSRYDSYNNYSRYDGLNGANGIPQDMSYLNNRYNNGYDRYNNGYNNGYDRYNNGYDRYNNGYDRYNNGYDRYNNGYDRYNNGYDRYSNGYDQLNNPANGQIGRLANDLARGNTGDAQYVAQTIMRSSDDPSRALNEANRLADQMACRMGYRSAMEHIAQTRSGDLAVVDQYGRQLARIENCNNGYNNGYDNRYYSNNGSYYDGRYSSGSGYYDPRYSSSSAYTNYDRYYNNSGYNGSYNNGAYYSGYSDYNQRYYGNSINGGQAAAAIGIGLLGGLIMSNIGRHNNYNNYNNYHHRSRW
jgi:hypothetical protein